MNNIRHFFDDFYKSLEIYFDKEIIFPYTYLEEMQQQRRMYNDCNIYMLLIADKLELRDNCERYLLECKVLMVCDMIL